jgi:hypothetical protein
MGEETIPPDDFPARGRGSLIALAVLALAAVIPLAAVANAEERGKSDSSRFSETKKKPRAARSERVRGGFVIPAIATQNRRKPPVGIPGRRDP